ncbi:sugar kinase [Phyllobacterium sp. 0TCS1.6C]|uniref:sugar kinase n=1 Tax=unclassified Phyllobacterium TaxID=2638441 RepID=UPI002264E530|nr:MULTISPECIES: sugar kinase [unclassified Phyllobacterium]MCX8279444.1 sugar kinase [Phyllobacterium sp. 0TCS1.6C]MCX8292365.1 sugar kinase [Phyllobacterium sp. 0TCS1.6A]
MGGFAAIGECMIELSGANGDQWRMGFAGDTLNSTWYVRALAPADFPVDYVTAFGDDPFSDKQRAFLAENGIKTAHSPTITGARPGLYAITLTEAERSFTYWRSDSAARQLADDMDALQRSLEGRRIIYFSGITMGILSPRARQNLISAVSGARRLGATVIFDANYRPRLWENAETAKQALSNAFHVSDIALPTFPDENALFGDPTPEETAARIASYGVKEIIVKDGTAPALVVENGQQTSVPAIAARAVDTTGAGDSFNGAYISARVAGMDPVSSAAAAHRVAARVVEYHGALAPMEEARKAFGVIPVDQTNSA